MLNWTSWELPIWESDIEGEREKGEEEKTQFMKLIRNQISVHAAWFYKHSADDIKTHNEHLHYIFHSRCGNCCLQLSTRKATEYGVHGGGEAKQNNSRRNICIGRKSYHSIGKECVWMRMFTRGSLLLPRNVKVKIFITRSHRNKMSKLLAKRGKCGRYVRYCFSTSRKGFTWAQTKF